MDQLLIHSWWVLGILRVKLNGYVPPQVNYDMKLIYEIICRLQTGILFGHFWSLKGKVLILPIMECISQYLYSTRIIDIYEGMHVCLFKNKVCPSLINAVCCSCKKMSFILCLPDCLNWCTSSSSRQSDQGKGKRGHFWSCYQQLNTMTIFMTMLKPKIWNYLWQKWIWYTAIDNWMVKIKNPDTMFRSGTMGTISFFL